MAFLSSYEGIYRVKVGPAGLDYYIDVREHISYKEREAAEKALSEMKFSGTQANVSPDVTRYRQLLMLAHISEWNLDDDGGAVWPVDFEHIGKLPDDVFDQVWQQVDAQPGKRSKETQRRFPDGLDVSDQVRKPRAGKLAEVPAGTATA
jgi:hypothetical protein